MLNASYAGEVTETKDGEKIGRLNPEMNAVMAGESGAGGDGEG